MNTQHFWTAGRVSCAAALGFSLALFSGTGSAQTGSGSTAAPAINNAAALQASAKPAPDLDDPREAERPDIGPPVADDTADGLRRSLKERKNHDKLAPGKAAPESYATGPQHPVARVQSEKDKKDKKDKLGKQGKQG